MEVTMPKRTQSYREWQMEKLADPERGASYLNTALRDSNEAFLIALDKVGRAREIAINHHSPGADSSGS